MSLLIAMPGPAQPESEAEVPAMRDALPALSALLARARRVPAMADWRAGALAALLGAQDAAAIPAVSVAARALPALPSGSALCFAEALHVVAGISRVHLPPGGRLRLDAAESRQWVETFNREFGGPELHLHDVAGGWLLAAPFARGARDPAPEDLVGQPLARTAARDADERALRRLGSEAEMWLAAHPLNREREARQQPPVNNLWFWGGATARPLPAPVQPPRAVMVAGEEDPWLAGLATHLAVPLVQVADWQAVAEGAVLVLQPPREGISLRHWQGLEAQWFAPMLRASLAGVLRARLQIGDTAWQLPDRSPLRWLRRQRHWHELVAA